MAEQAWIGTVDLEDTFLSDTDHKTKVTLCAVMKNKIGEVVYAFYLEDEENLTQPLGFEIRVRPGGGTKYRKVDPEEMLELINEELDTSRDTGE